MTKKIVSIFLVIPHYRGTLFSQWENIFNFKISNIFLRIWSWKFRLQEIGRFIRKYTISSPIVQLKAEMKLHYLDTVQNLKPCAFIFFHLLICILDPGTKIKQIQKLKNLISFYFVRQVISASWVPNQVAVWQYDILWQPSL